MSNQNSYKVLRTLIVFFLLSINFCFGQNPDTTDLSSKKQFTFYEDDTSHSARIATIYSAILPGLGQAYNRKYWKIPLVYAAIGGCLTAAILNNGDYRDAHNELIYRQDHPGLTYHTQFDFFDDDQLLASADYSRKWRDNMYIFTGLAYVLNLIDANVDGHLFNFDVSEDLALNITPFAYSNSIQRPVTGLSFTLKFK